MADDEEGEALGDGEVARGILLGLQVVEALWGDEAAVGAGDAGELEDVGQVAQIGLGFAIEGEGGALGRLVGKGVEELGVEQTAGRGVVVPHQGAVGDGADASNGLGWLRTVADEVAQAD